MQLNITEEESLWVSLHDGILESLTSDRLARSVVLVIDVPYIWEFHAKPDTTRFHVLLEGVRNTTALDIALWPGNSEIKQDLPWDAKEAMHKQLYEFGRLQSMDWEATATRLNSAEDYDISAASVNRAERGFMLLKLSLMNQVTHDYPQSQITADNIRFWVHPESRELSLDDFTAMGRQYWDDFGKGKHSQATQPSTNH